MTEERGARGPRKGSGGLTWVERFLRNVGIVLGYAEGETVAAIAVRTGMTAAMVRIVLREAGISSVPDRVDGGTARGDRLVERNASMQVAREKGATLAAIAETFGVSRARVFAIVEEKEKAGKA